MNIRLSVAALIFLAYCQTANALEIDLYSGNGSIGGTDSAITFLAGPANSAFTTPFSTTDFNSARTGNAAAIIAPHSAWETTGEFATAGGDPSAQWISDKSTGASEGSTALYAIDFNIPFAVVSSAVMDFYWSVDNVLGNTTNAGVFINGTAVSGIGGGTFSNVFSSANIDISSLVVSGNNTLYINAIDLGGPAGLIFSAALDITEGTNGSVPVPTPLALLGLGLLLIGYTQKKATT